LDKLYENPSVQKEKDCLIHGDPTVANIMLRDFEFVIIDPIPPVGKIPSYKEVDLAKIMQSALGYEYNFNKEYERSVDTWIIDVILSYSNYREEAKVWFWTGIHCLRILPYDKKLKLLDWVTKTSQYCNLKCKELL
jgi:hypothetical protein